ncbi:UNVERIFIED_CONTAM: hypothetical protein RMT77_013948 [Armadillidium vulgare]
MNYVSLKSLIWNNGRRIHTAIRNKMYVKVDDFYINYESSGSRGKKVAFCLPGSLGSAKTDFSPQLASLGSKNLEVISWDPPGYGDSRPPSRDFSGNFFVRDSQVAANFMKVLNYNTYSLLGWSDGGITALQMAISCPERVEKLVVWGANAFIDEKDVKLYNNIRDVNKWSERMRKPMEDLYGMEYFKSKWEEWIDAMALLSFRNGGYVLKGDLSTISCPTLIIHGKKDPMVGEYHAQYLHKNIRGSQLYIMEDGKHNLHLKYVDEFNKLVSDFLHK